MTFGNMDYSYSDLYCQFEIKKSRVETVMQKTLFRIKVFDVSWHAGKGTGDD